MAMPSPPCALSSVVPVLAVLAVLYSWLLATVNQVVPDPYMVRLSLFFTLHCTQYPHVTHE